MEERKCAGCNGPVEKGHSYCDRCLSASKKYSSIFERTKGNEKKSIEKWGRAAFIKWYIKQKDECHFCHITEEQSFRYYEHLRKSGYRTTLNSTRGKSFEVDRLDNKGLYTDKNCKLVCYYCNNAKSDVFNEQQFVSIGKAIGDQIEKVVG